MTRHRRRSRGFTLVELVASMAVLAVILLACGSIVAMALRATNDAAVRASTQYQTADAAAQVADDLNVAINFTQRSATSATFTVPDRLNLGAPQTVAYSWAGTTGSPLLRQFNGGPVTTLLPSAQNFQLTYLTRPMGTGQLTPTDLYSHTVATTLKDVAIDNKNYAAFSYTPTLAAGVSSYTLTKLRIQLKCAGGQDGILKVSVTAPGLLSSPASNVLATATVYESSLSTAYEYVDVPFTGLSGLNPLQTICFVFSYSSGGTQVGMIETDSAPVVAASGVSWMTSTNAGSTWSPASTAISPLFHIFGTVP